MSMICGLQKQYSNLWQSVFKDGREFTEKYFSVFLNDESFFYINKGDLLISALTGCKYLWKFLDTELPFVYLSGILTRKEYRSKGYCGKLINNVFNTLYKRGVPLCGLIAADKHLTEYYNGFGFINCYSLEGELFSKKTADTVLLGGYTFTDGANVLQDIYKDFLNREDNCVVHDDRTLSLYKGKGYCNIAAVKDGIIAAFAVCTEYNGDNVVLYLYSEDGKSKKALLSFLSLKADSDIRILEEDNRMLRIIDVRKILQIYASRNKEVKMRLQITDAIIKENNVFVEIHSGRVTDTERTGNFETLSAEELSARLFENGRMYLMTDV